MRFVIPSFGLACVLGLAACGGTVVFESDGGSGDGGGSGVTTASSTGPTSTAAVTATTSTGGGGDATTAVGVTVSSVDVAVSSGQGGSVPSDAPCGSVCAGDPGCGLIPVAPAPGSPCEICVQDEAAMGTKSVCTVEGLLGECCQNRSDCADYVNCVLGGLVTCARDFPEGNARAVECVYASCGDCGDPG